MEGAPLTGMDPQGEDPHQDPETLIDEITKTCPTSGVISEIQDKDLQMATLREEDLVTASILKRMKRIKGNGN